MDSFFNKKEEVDVGEKYILHFFENRINREIRMDVYYNEQRINRISYISPPPKVITESFVADKVKRVNRLREIGIANLNEMESTVFKKQRSFEFEEEA